MKRYIKDFLQAYPSGYECSLQTFDDKWQDQSKARIFQVTDENIDKVIELNKNWAWVFFSVNTMIPGKRDKASVQKLNAYFTEIDYGTKEDQQKLIFNAPVAPSLVVESKNWFHIYYYAKEHKSDDNWYNIMRGLCNYYGWDSKVIDTSRVLRLPWTYHNKGEPYEITVFTWTWLYHSEEDMMKAFSDHRTNNDKRRELEVFERGVRRYVGSNFRERIKQMNTMEVLKKLSGHEFVSWETFEFRRNNNWTHQIIINGRPTSNWIDKQWKPAVSSWSTWGGNWVSYVFWYGICTPQSLSKWVKENYPEVANQEEDNDLNVKPKYTQKIVESDLNIELPNKDKLMTWGNQYVDEAFGMLENDYCIIASWTGEWKTLWSTWIASQNWLDWKKVAFVTIELTPAKIKRRYAMQCMWLTRYESQVKEYTHKEKDYLNKKYKEFDKDFDLIWMKSPTITEIEEMIRELHKDGYELVILDNMGKISADGKNELEQQRKISSDLQDLKNELGISIILIHHFKKQGKTKSYSKDMLRGNQKVADDATLIITLERDLETNVTTLNLCKLTDGLASDYEAMIYFEKWQFHDFH